MRYEGTVIKIDKVERALHLSQVRQFGTEGRRGGNNEIAPKDEVIEMVVFKIELVENFLIIEDEAPKVQQKKEWDKSEPAPTEDPVQEKP